VIVAGCEVDMTRFSTAQHIALWPGLCPGHHESAGKQKTGRARKDTRRFASCSVRPAGPGCGRRTPISRCSCDASVVGSGHAHRARRSSRSRTR
jgi:hypothetical protein